MSIQKKELMLIGIPIGCFLVYLYLKKTGVFPATVGAKTPTTTRAGALGTQAGGLFTGLLSAAFKGVTDFFGGSPSTGTNMGKISTDVINKISPEELAAWSEGGEMFAGAPGYFDTITPDTSIPADVGLW